MRQKSAAVSVYITAQPEDRAEALNNFRKICLERLPEGFEETMSYSMPSYVVPHTIYPSGYHCAPKEPLPFISFASSKAHVSFHHMGMYADEKTLEWFTQAYKSQFNKKPDMGKSCIRFKKLDSIPYDLLEELVQKISVKEWIEIYEREIKR